MVRSHRNFELWKFCTCVTLIANERRNTIMNFLGSFFDKYFLVDVSGGNNDKILIRIPIDSSEFFVPNSFDSKRFRSRFSKSFTRDVQECVKIIIDRNVTNICKDIDTSSNKIVRFVDVLSLSNFSLHFRFIIISKYSYDSLFRRLKNCENVPNWTKFSARNLSDPPVLRLIFSFDE